MFLNFLFATFMFLMQIASWAFRAEILYNITKLHFCSLQHIRLVKNKLRQRHYPHFTLRTECTITTTNLNSVLKPSHLNREPHLTHLCKDSPKLLLTFSVHSAISVFQSMRKICRKPYYRYYQLAAEMGGVLITKHVLELSQAWVPPQWRKQLCN